MVVLDSIVDITFESVTYGVLATALLVSGLAITALAYRGYRKYESRPMLFFAVGFGCLLLAQIVILPLSAFFGVGPFIERTSIQLTQLAGTLCILYALRIEA